MRHARPAVALLLVLFAFSSFAAITGTVMTTDGAPLAGARVSIRAIESQQQRRARLMRKELPVALASVETDSKGAFSIPSPKEPVVSLQVELNGYGVSGRRVERDEEVGAIALSQRAMRTGAITAGGKPVPNALVAIDGDNIEIVRRTNEQGRFETPDLRGAGSIVVIHSDYAVDQQRFVSSTPAASGLNRVLVPGVSISGRTVTANGSPVAKAIVSVDGWPVATSGDDGAFVVPHAPARWKVITATTESLFGQRASGAKDGVVKMEKMATVTGRITDGRTKFPVSGAIVSLARSPMTPQAVWFSTTADSKGGYSIHVPPAAYRVIASHPAYGGQSAEATALSGQEVVKDLSVQPLARVSGTVFDEERRPVTAAAITAEDSREDGMMRRFSSDATGVMSGPDGRFALRTSSDREIRVRAAKKGLPPVQSEGFRLGAGERKTGVVLTIASGIAVSGRALDAEGKPLSGVAVRVNETPASGSESAVMRSVMIAGRSFDEDADDAVQTASDGTFTTRVREGTWDFTFSREGFVPKNVRAQNVTARGAEPIEVRMEPSVEVTGRVIRGGTGVPDVMIYAVGSIEPIPTGPDGSFTIRGLAPGPVRMMLRSENEFVQAQRSITAPASDVIIELPAGVTVSGRVVDKESSKPIPSFQAGLATSRSGGGMMMMGPPQLRSFTSDDGSFTLEHVPPGSTNIVASAPGYVGAHLNVEVQEGKDISDLRLELETGVRLVGRITGPDGAPVSDAAVMINPSPTGSAALRGAFPRTSTDSKGEYVLEGLGAGEESVRVSHPKYATTSKSVTLKGGETRLDVQLSAGLRVAGTVVTEDGMPVADAEVTAYGAGIGDRARTNASGAFSFESMPPGRYRFTASKSGYASATLEDVDVATSGPVRVTLKNGGTIYGRITGLAPQDFESAAVAARASTSSASAPVDPQGNYRIEGAPTGSVRVSASVRSGTNYRTSPVQTVELASGSAQQVDIDFGGTLTISGRVRRNGAPVAGANVTFIPRRSTSQTVSSAAADDQGRYTLAGLEAGEYDVRVNDVQRFSSHATTYTVRGSATFDIDFKGATVRGRVIDSSTREPIANVIVQFRPASQTEARGMPSTATTDAEGRFVFDFISPGAWVVNASREDYGAQTVETTIGDSGRDDLELMLEKSDGVILKVVDARDGRALTADAVVFDMQGRPASGEMLRWNRSSDQLRIPLAPGTYVASVSSFNYAPRTVTLQSPSSPTIALSPGGTIVLQSRHSARLRYRLLDTNGLPYPRTTAQPIPRPFFPGSTTLEHIAPGAYTLQLINDDESVADTKQVVVREGETVSAEL